MVHDHLGVPDKKGARGKPHRAQKIRAAPKVFAGWPSDFSRGGAFLGPFWGLFFCDGFVGVFFSRLGGGFRHAPGPTGFFILGGEALFRIFKMGQTPPTPQNGSKNTPTGGRF
ncbi:MAG: hypothetical protein CM15mP74_15770 [Halieaceae bacterium]|nr:MAG: hypothetical protein CM15mP74_15770 [Halieaceae bacterium]